MRPYIDLYDRRLARWAPCGAYVPRAERVAHILAPQGLTLGTAYGGHVLFASVTATDGTVHCHEMRMMTRDPAHHRTMPLREALLALGCVPATP